MSARLPTLADVVRGRFGQPPTFDPTPRQYAPDTRTGDLFGKPAIDAACRRCVRWTHETSDCSVGTCGLTGERKVAADQCEDFKPYDWHD